MAFWSSQKFDVCSEELRQRWYIMNLCEVDHYANDDEYCRIECDYHNNVHRP